MAGEIAGAGAGIVTPTRGSTTQDLGTAVGAFLAGQEQRRREEEARALEQAKLAISQQQADAQMTQAEAYSRQVEDQALDAAVRRERDAVSLALDVARANREEQRHPYELAEMESEARQREAAARNAPALRRTLTQVAISNPAMLGMGAAEVAGLDEFGVADLWNRYQERLGILESQKGSFAMATASGLQNVLESVSQMRDRDVDNARQAQDAYTAALEPLLQRGLVAVGDDGEVVLNSLLPADQQEALAGQFQHIQALRQQVVDAQTNLQRSEQMYNLVPSLVEESMANIAAVMGGQAMGRAGVAPPQAQPGAGGGGAGVQPGAGGASGVSQGAAGGAERGPMAPLSFRQESRIRNIAVSYQEQQAAEAQKQEEMVSVLMGTYTRDPSLFSQQMSVLTQRFPSFGETFQARTGINLEAVQEREAQAGARRLQATQDELRVNFATENSLAEVAGRMKELIQRGSRGGWGGRYAMPGGAGRSQAEVTRDNAEIVRLVRHLAGQPGMSLEVLQGAMGISDQRLENLPVWQFVKASWPTRIPQ